MSAIRGSTLKQMMVQPPGGAEVRKFYVLQSGSVKYPLHTLSFSHHTLLPTTTIGHGNEGRPCSGENGNVC